MAEILKLSRVNSAPWSIYVCTYMPGGQHEHGSCEIKTYNPRIDNYKNFSFCKFSLSIFLYNNINCIVFCTTRGSILVLGWTIVLRDGIRKEFLWKGKVLKRSRNKVGKAEAGSLSQMRAVGEMTHSEDDEQWSTYLIGSMRVVLRKSPVMDTLRWPCTTPSNWRALWCTVMLTASQPDHGHSVSTCDTLTCSCWPTYGCQVTFSWKESLDNLLLLVTLCILSSDDLYCLCADCLCHTLTYLPLLVNTNVCNSQS